jgi:predicted site-specific integrase-resolvase
MENSNSSSGAKGKRFLRVNNVVRRIGAAERTVRYWAATGRLRAVRLGKKIWVFDPDVVEAFARERRDHEGNG